MKRTLLLGIALVALGAGGTGCSARKAEQAWQDTFGHREAQARSVDLNTASRKQLASLPGLTDDDADRIIQNRPYPNKQALVNRKVIGSKKFDEIRDYVYVTRAQ